MGSGNDINYYSLPAEVYPDDNPLIKIAMYEFTQKMVITPAKDAVGVTVDVYIFEQPHQIKISAEGMIPGVFHQLVNILEKVKK